MTTKNEPHHGAEYFIDPLSAQTNKVYYFAHDRIPKNKNGHRSPERNLMDPFFHGRYVLCNQFLKEYCRTVGEVEEITLKDAKRMRYIYEIGTSGPPANWLGGYDSSRRNLFDLLAIHRPNVLKSAAKRKCIIHIDQGWEGFPLLETKVLKSVGVPRDYYDVLYTSLEKYKIPPSQLLITTSNLKEKEIHDKYYGNKKDKINIIPSISFCGLLKYQNGADAISFEEQIEYKSTAKDMKSFSCLNRVTRQHRMALGVMLNYYNLLDPKICDFSHSKFLGGHPKQSTVPITHRHAIPGGWDPHPSFTRENANNFILKLPLVLDQEDFNKNHVWTMFKDTYLRTWFSLTSETAFSEEHETCLFMSEKIFKPMLCHQPFVVASHPNSLAQLKQLGFKTFDKWWDEHYDTIVTPTARMEAICKLTQELTNKSDSEWLEMYKDMQEVLEHNFNHMTAMRGIDYSGIIK